MGMMFFCNRCGKQVDRETLGRLGEWSYPYKKYESSISSIASSACNNYCSKTLIDPIGVTPGYEYCEECRSKLINLIENFNQNKI